MKRKGFTLVECIVAIAVITLISASAVTVYSTSTSNNSKQWGKYLSEVVSDNALSCFKASETIETFNTKLGNQFTSLGVVDSSETTTETVESIGDPTYNTMTFTEIRAYEGKKIEFVNGSTVVSSFEYTDSSKYASELQYMIDFFGDSVTEKTQPITEIPLHSNFQKDGFCGHYYTYKKETKDGSTVYNVYYTVQEGWEETTVCFSQSEFEKYLFDNAYYIVPQVWTKSNGHNIIWFDVYSAVYDAKISNSDGNLYFGVESSNWGDNFVGKNLVSSYWTNATCSVSNVYYAYGEAAKTNYTKLNNKTYSWNWEYYPIIPYYCLIHQSVSGSTNYGMTGNFHAPYTFTGESHSNGLPYTSYTFKSGSNCVLGTILAKTGDMRLYSQTGADTYDINTAYFFKYTDSKQPTALNAFLSASFREHGSNGDFNQYHIYTDGTKTSTTVSTPVSKTYKYSSIPENSKYGCYMEITYSATKEKIIKTWICPVSNGNLDLSKITTTTPYSTYTKG